MNFTTLLLIVVSPILQDLPFKAKEEFEIKLNYQFKQRPQADLSTVYLDETNRERNRRTSNDQLPYLILNVKMLKLSQEEVRARIDNNLNIRVGSKKISEGTVLTIDAGFTADIKDRVEAHEYTITIMSPAKSEVSRIVIHVEEDGTFLVNGEKRGKF